MNNYIELGKVLLDIKEYDTYIAEAEKLETVIQTYYQDLTIPTYPCWLQYANERNLVGTVSITANLYKHPVLSKLTTQLASVLNQSNISKNFIFKSTKINLIRTTGMVGIHQDQGNRTCAINIGLRNSENAITKISDGVTIENFEEICTRLQVKDGCAYLINTSNWHSVDSDIDSTRYLITYSFAKEFSEVKESINILT